MYPYPVDAQGLWVQRLHPGAGPALFLDRDGVIVVEVGYLHRAEDVRLERGAAALIAAANARRIPVVVVTNQAGLARGYYGWEAFAAVQARMLADLAAAGAFVNAVLACPYHQTGQPPYGGVPDHPARKPNPGMLLRAAEILELDLAGSWIVGDRASDLEAGRRAGLAGGVHVSTGHGRRAGERGKACALASDRFLVRCAETLDDARSRIPLVS